jgi:hypothetical protein
MSALSRRAPLQAKIRKKCMFFGTTILETFGDDLGTILGVPKRHFLHFFRFLGEANFDAFFGTPKKR